MMLMRRNEAGGVDLGVEEVEKCMFDVDNVIFKISVLI